MRSLHFHLPFGMYHRARAPSIRFRLPPTLWTDYLLVPPISMLQQQLPQHLSHQLPSLKRQLACYLIKARLRMLLPPLPHLLKHRLRTSHKFRLRLFSFHLAPPFALLSSYSKSTSFQPRKKSGMHPWGVRFFVLNVRHIKGFRKYRRFRAALFLDGVGIGLSAALQAVAQSSDRSSACSSTVCVAFSCLSGG